MSEMIAQYSTVCSNFAAFPGVAVWKVLQDSTVENAILRLIGPAAFTMRKRAKHLDSATLMVSLLPGCIPRTNTNIRQTLSSELSSCSGTNNVFFTLISTFTTAMVWKKLSILLIV